MNSHIDALASRLGQAKISGVPTPGSIQNLPHFLSTSQGREAVRGVVDSVVARYKMQGTETSHKDIINNLIQHMGDTP